MAGAGFLTLLDDIATLLDDVAVLSKRAATRAIGVSGDDLAVRSEQLAGLASAREIPVIKKVAKGSLRNKAILVPSLLLMSLYTPVLITPLLIGGGLYLSYEGMEKIVEKIFHKKHEETDQERAARLLTATPEKLEQEQIDGAIKTDFIMSAEILLLAMGAVALATPVMQAAVLAAVGVLMTAFVYTSVAGIVKMDDLGFWLKKKAENNTGIGATLQNAAGTALIKSAPWLMKFLAIAGTVAMLGVGGGMLTHNIPMLAALTHGIPDLIMFGVNAAAGVAAGLGVVGVMKIASPMISKITEPVSKAVEAVVSPILKPFKKLFGKKEPAAQVKTIITPPSPEAVKPETLKKTPDLGKALETAATPTFKAPEKPSKLLADLKNGQFV